MSPAPRPNPKPLAPRPLHERILPFGLAARKPRHFREMAAAVWENRDALGYAWQVLSRGVCDGCALGVAGLRDWTITGPHLCLTRLSLLRLNTMGAGDPAALADVEALAGWDNTRLRTLGRLAFPMVRRRGERGFRQVSWDEALARLGARIRATEPDRLAFFVTARGVTNEVYYLAQKAARFLGTSHVDNAARLCHAPSTAAMREMTGTAAASCSYIDWIESELIVLFGSNLANDQPVAMKYLLLAKRRGARIVVVNPLLEPGLRRYWVPSDVRSALFGSDFVDEWYPVAPGGDVACLYGVLKALLAQGGVDTTWIAEHTEEFARLRAVAEGMEWSQLEAASGLSRAQLEAFAATAARARRGVLIWSMGITQQPEGADGVRMILNLALARGWIGRDGCGVVPIRGHSSSNYALEDVV